ncbi:MAG: hypothetical protein AAF289_00535 [Cyanobacteria bacterium P01_A01_bin.135]
MGDDLRADYRETLAAKLAKFNQEIDALTQQLDQMQGADAETVASYQRYLDAMQIKRKAVELKVAELDEADGTLWDALQGGIDEVWQDLTSTLERATAEFEAGQRLRDGLEDSQGDA